MQILLLASPRQTRLLSRVLKPNNISFDTEQFSLDVPETSKSKRGSHFNNFERGRVGIDLYIQQIEPDAKFTGSKKPIFL